MAAALVQLVEAGIIINRTEVVARAAHVLAVPLALVGAAASEQRVHGYKPPLWAAPPARPPRLATVAPPAPSDDTRAKTPPPSGRKDPPAPEDDAGDDGVPIPTLESQRPCNRASFLKKNPEPGMRLCTICGPEVGPVPIGRFNVKSRATGGRMPWCRDCGKAQAAGRYVAANEAGIVNFARAHLQPGSPFIGQICPECDARLQAGEEVEGADVILRHVSCPGAAPPGSPRSSRGNATGPGPSASAAGPGGAPKVQVAAAAGGDDDAGGDAPKCVSHPILGWDAETGESVPWRATGASAVLSNGNVEVWGASGTGKTEWLKVLLAQLAARHGSRFGVIDFKNDFSDAGSFPAVTGSDFYDLWADGLPMNPLALSEAATPRAIDRAVIEMRDAVAVAAGSFARMGHRQLDRLRCLLEQAYAAGEPWPTLRTLHHLISDDPELLAVMGDLTRNDIFRDGPPLAEATKRNVVFGLSTIPGSGVTTKLAAGFILSALMLHLLAQPPVARTIGYALAIDEAHRVGDLKATSAMAREGWGHGLALLVATQQPELGDVIGTNAATRICFGLPDATVAAAAAKRLDRSQPQLADRIRTLPEGYAFVRLGAAPLQRLRMAQFYRDHPVVLASPSNPEPTEPPTKRQRP